jgi:hypothetical protein
MNRVLIFLIIIVLMVSGCATRPQQTVEQPTDTPVPATSTPIPLTGTSIPPTDTPTAIPPTDTPLPPTLTRVPTSTKKPTSMRKPVESAEEIIRIWQQRLTSWTGGNNVYLVFNQDGTFHYSEKSHTALEDAPTVIGEYWFEDGLLHVHDTSNTFADPLWPACDTSNTGIYWVTMISPTKINLKPKTDPCSCKEPDPCRRSLLGGDWEQVEE